MRDDNGPCFYCPDLPPEGEQGSLHEEETHHASASRRVRVGDSIGLIDGRGVLAGAVVEAVARRKLTFTVRRRRTLAPPEPAVHVASAVAKGERFRALVDMLAQIGVAALLPLVCERSAVKPRSSSTERWRRVALEACKQSRNPYVPEVREARSLGDSLAELPAEATVVFADAEGADPGEVLPVQGALYVYVGPEGGFNEAEKQQLRERGARPLRLGPNVLRVETAAMAAAVLSLLGPSSRRDGSAGS